MINNQEKDKNKKTILAYNNNPEFYANKFDSYGIRFEDIDQAIKLNMSGSDKVLELGCGNGRDAQYIISKLSNSNYLGIDASEELIRIAKENNPEAHLQVQDMRDCNVTPETYGIIFSFASMLHVNREEMINLIDKCHKMLKTGGILFISTKYGEYKEKMITNMGDTKYYYFYKPEDIMKLCPNKFFVVYKNVQDIEGQSWFEIILRKI